jgi:DNA/RNA-binding domain of Phe-tRNA-synthetase-like protein
MIVYESDTSDEILVCDDDQEEAMREWYFKDPKQRNLRNYRRSAQCVAVILTTNMSLAKLARF